ncbi:MAG: M3 family oligoendopeptidase [Phototrophicaceae bacterium]
MVDAPLEKKTGAEDVIWDLSVYYDAPDDPRIDEDLAEIKAQVVKFVEDYRGKVGELVAEEVGEAFSRLENIYDDFGRVTSFASLNFSVFSNDPEWGAFIQKVQEFSSAISQELVFFNLEWNAVEDDHAKEIMADPVLRDYAYHLEVERLSKPYQLSESEEKLLMEKSLTGNGAWNRFFDQVMGSLTAKWDGEDLPFTQVLSNISGNPDREIRKKAADAVTEALKSKTMELTYIFNVLAADKASNDRLRGYPTWITSRNLSNKASDETVEALIEAVTSNYSIVADHYNIKKALLGYDEMYDYDRYAPLTLKESDTFYTWDDAKKIVLDAYSDFNPRMGEIASRFFDENWIHAPVVQGKRGGAYASYGTKSTHPWIFTNFTGTANDVSTLAHEMGHGLHMYLAGEKQTYMSMFTPLTTAETASVFGEMIVFQDLMKKETDKEAQLAMLTEKIDGTFATVFRQISMNRFEDAMHTARREEGELSTERLNELWMQSQLDMFQGSVTMREDYAQWWSYIPHFLGAPGYVYAYAFGELLVLALYNLYEQTGDSFIPKYIELLASGDNDYPENLLAKVGVDLNDPEFWNKGIDLIRSLVQQEKELAMELYPDKF